MKKHIALIVLAGLVISCGQSSESEQVINYSELEEIPIELDLEIKESEDFLPGNLTGLFVDQEGNILVSDYSSTTIKQFDSEGNYVATVAEEGGGPGELDQYFFMYHIGLDTLVVREQSQERTYFAPDEEGIYQYARSSNSGDQNDRILTMSILGQHTDTTFWATIGQSFSNIQETRKNNIDYQNDTAVIVNSAHEVVRDSVHMLKSPVGHLTEMNGGFMINSIPYRTEDRLRPIDTNRYMIARPDSNAFYIYNAEHEQLERIPFHVGERTVSSEDKNYSVRNISDEMRGEVENRISDTKPPYLNVWTTDEYILLHTDNTDEGKQMAVVDYQGNALGTFWLPESDNIQQLEGKNMYTLHQNSEEGHTIRKYDIQL